MLPTKQRTGAGVLSNCRAHTVDLSPRRQELRKAQVSGPCCHRDQSDASATIPSAQKHTHGHVRDVEYLNHGTLGSRDGRSQNPTVVPEHRCRVRQ
jgi:hypothetical protein